MTTTIDDLTTSEADLTPGTLCWVQTDSTVPALARNGRCLAVYGRRGVAALAAAHPRQR